jgi:predicted outer membrane protein
VRRARVLWLTAAVVALAALSVAVMQSYLAGTPGIGGWVNTPWGPLGPADRDLIIKVRQANLWEGPTAQQAIEQATTKQVKEVGEHLSKEHADLDAKTRAIAEQLGVILPAQPSRQQQGWMTEIAGQRGTDYDRVFIQRVRQAHGIVLPIIADVRVGTRNTLVRQFADTANQFVTRHIGYLESTGLVDFENLPPPTSPGLFGGGQQWTDYIIPLVIFVTTLSAGGALIVTAVRRRQT